MKTILTATICLFLIGKISSAAAQQSPQPTPSQMMVGQFAQALAAANDALAAKDKQIADLTAELKAAKSVANPATPEAPAPK